MPRRRHEFKYPINDRPIRPLSIRAQAAGELTFNRPADIGPGMEYRWAYFLLRELSYQTGVYSNPDGWEKHPLFTKILSMGTPGEILDWAYEILNTWASNQIHSDNFCPWVVFSLIMKSNPDIDFIANDHQGRMYLIICDYKNLIEHFKERNK